MSSKRNLRRQSCEGKIRFTFKQDAIAAACSYRHAYGGDVQPYKCSFGNHYHIGHTPSRIKRIIRQRRGV